MHPNPAFRQVSADESLAFARHRRFGTLSVNGETGPIMAHVPFLISETDALCALVHLARSNAIARADLPSPAVIAVTPDNPDTSTGTGTGVLATTLLPSPSWPYQLSAARGAAVSSVERDSAPR